MNIDKLHLDEIHHNSNVVNKLEHLAKKKSLPHIIISGENGVGKRTLIRAFINRIYGLETFEMNYKVITRKYNNKKIDFTVLFSGVHFEFNPSLYGFYDNRVTQDFIKETTYHRLISKKRKHRIIVIHDADKLTHDTQQSLRSTLERNVSTTRFIFIVKKMDNMIGPIRSRCIQLRCMTPRESEMTTIAKDICKKEDIIYDDEGLANIVHNAKHNISNLIDIIHSTHTNYGKINGSNIIISDIEHHEIITYARKLGNALIDMIQKKKFNLIELRDLIYDFMVISSDNFKYLDMLMTQLINHVIENDYVDKHKTIKNITNIFMKYENTMKKCSKEMYHFDAILINLCDVMMVDV